MVQSALPTLEQATEDANMIVAKLSSLQDSPISFQDEVKTRLGNLTTPSRSTLRNSFDEFQTPSRSEQSRTSIIDVDNQSSGQRRPPEAFSLALPAKQVADLKLQLDIAYTVITDLQKQSPDYAEHTISRTEKEVTVADGGKMNLVALANKAVC